MGLTDSLVEFGLIPRDEWKQPSFINETRATEAREKMVKDNVIYGGTWLDTDCRSLSLTPLQAAFREYHGQ